MPLTPLPTIIVFLQSWPWPLQDPTPQKYPRLDSADMGVGMYVLGMIFESVRRITIDFSWKLAIGFK